MVGTVLGGKRRGRLVVVKGERYAVYVCPVFFK